MLTCIIKGCKEKHMARGYCKNHYKPSRYAEKKVCNDIIDWDENTDTLYTNKGYIMIMKRLNGKRIHKSFHRYIWEKHNGIIPKGCIIHHINGIKTDNRIENLKCLSNSVHAKLHCNIKNKNKL